MKNKLKYILLRVALWLTPVVLLSVYRMPLSIEERGKYFIKGFLKLLPITFFINIVLAWHSEHEIFLNSLYGILLVNATVGIITHFKLNTFDIGEFFKSTLITIAVIFAVYFSLDKLGNSIPEGFIEISFTSSVQVMTLLFPISKIVRNSFILSNGKFPPQFLIEKLYNYERDGNLRSFLDFINSKNDNDDEESSTAA